MFTYVTPHTRTGGDAVESSHSSHVRGQDRNRRHVHVLPPPCREEATARMIQTQSRASPSFLPYLLCALHCILVEYSVLPTTPALSPHTHTLSLSLFNLSPINSHHLPNHHHQSDSHRQALPSVLSLCVCMFHHSHQQQQQHETERECADIVCGQRERERERENDEERDVDVKNTNSVWKKTT